MRMGHKKKRLCLGNNKTKDILLRDLDCAVIQQVQTSFSNDGNPAFDSVRGVFTEGKHPYRGSAFFSKTHVQICVCNPNCIKGYFEPREIDSNFRLP